jgi:hypothetical protein
MRALRIVAALFCLCLSTGATAQSIPTPRFDELERKLQIRPEQKEQYEMAVGATKRALLAVGLSAVEMKQRLAAELMKPSPDFSFLFNDADKVFEQHRPLFEEAGREWKKLYTLLDDRQVKVVKDFLSESLGGMLSQPLLPPPKPQPKAAPEREWI